MRKAWLTRNVLVLGVVSLLTDTSSEMILPLLPAFLTTVLGGGALALGWIEGLADGVASLLKFFSGRFSDRLHKTRPFVIAGYALASVVRPLVAISTVAWHLLAIRVADRVGKGLRTSPRDALIAASVPKECCGMAYGFHRAMDHAGAVLGPLLAVLILCVWPGSFRTVFWLAAIPGALVIIVVIFGIRDVNQGAQEVPGSSDGEIAVAKSSGWALARFLIPLGLFTLGNSSDVFLLLKAGSTDTPLIGLPLLWMAFHVVKSTTSLAGGWLSDRFGRRRMIVIGWFLYAGVYAGFAFAESRTAVVALFLVYGGYYGLTEGAEKALIAEIAPAQNRGAAFGWYHLVIGFLTLPASVLFGALWEMFGNRTAFLVGSTLALLGVVLLLCLTGFGKRVVVGEKHGPA
jgi:MFS family permease